MTTALTFAALALALLPFVMTVANLRALGRPSLPATMPAIAILIPARDEAATIGACVAAALDSRHADIEVVVLDDGSRDGTAEVARAAAPGDARLRVEAAPHLPSGWNGKQHACHVLTGLTDRPLLLFIDADVRLAPEGAARLAGALERGRADLVSGVPRQVMGSLAERLMIPMISALILGYLPIALMRRDSREALAAGCGQLMLVRRDAYVAAGGHAAIRTSLHDGLKLPRLFRRNGFRTDLVDGTDLAACRMYAGRANLVRGFLKNATEGMAKPVALPVWTVLLFGGHVLPWSLLAAAAMGGTGLLPLTLLACLSPLVARLLQAMRCREPVEAVPLHPLAVLATLAIQWAALLRAWLRIETEWRGRAYRPQS